MIGINDLKLMNYTTITFLEDINQSTQRNKIISKILKDEACFFKMKREDAYEIIEQIGVEKDKIGKVYNDLISEQSFYKLKKDGKIKDEECVVYKTGACEEGSSKNKFEVDLVQQDEAVTNTEKYEESKFKNVFQKMRDFFYKNRL